MAETRNTPVAVECGELVERFVDMLVSLMLSVLEGRRSSIGLTDVIDLAYEFMEKHACNEDIGPLARVYESAAKLVLDKAMEALSTHMEELDYGEYSFLSVMLTRYAVHVMRLAASALESSRKYGELKDSVLAAFEPLIFTSTARSLALAKLVATMDRRKLLGLLPRLRDLIEEFMAEENAMLSMLQA